MSSTDPLIPRAVLLGNPSRFSPRISPDGQFISFIAPYDGALNIWVCPVDELGAAKPITRNKKRGIQFHAWMQTSKDLIYLLDRDGDENYRVYRVSASGEEPIDLTPFPRVRSKIIKLSPKFPHEALLGFNHRDPHWHDVFRLNLISGASQLVCENLRFSRFLADDDLRLRLSIKNMPDGGYDVCASGEETAWMQLFHVTKEDALTTHLVGLGPAEGHLIYMLDSRFRDTAAAVEIDISAGTSRVLGEHSNTDVVQLVINPFSRRAEAYRTNHLKSNWSAIEPAVEADFCQLRKLADGEFDLTSRTADDQKWIVTVSSDKTPATYYAYDRARRETSLLFSSRPELENWRLEKMRPCIIPSRDGLELVSYLTLPSSISTRNAEQRAPGPMVLIVHGGPWSRDKFGYNPLHQLLANRGYVVLSVNFRGSTGFGKNFLNAGDHEWGGRMQDDLIDAVKWTIDRGLAHKDRIAIMGASYGGYATLVGLTSTPELFACGIDMFGPSNLETFLATIPPYWKSFFETFSHRIGDPREESGRRMLQERSPLHKSHQITRPLLVAQGANDVRAVRAESDQLVDAMERRGQQVIYLLYSDEGHNFVRSENRLSFLAIVESFLAAHLGGACQAFENDLVGADLQVIAGANIVDHFSKIPTRTSPRLSLP